MLLRSKPYLLHAERGQKDVEKSRNCLDTLKHRGPDQWGEFYDDLVYLGHRRLSILDLSENGRQPMYNRDKNIVIGINGEIYNYTELKKELEKRNGEKND